MPPDPVPMTVIESIRFWFEASSIDGIGQAGRARNPVTRSMWVLILLVGIAATAYHLYWILIEYHDYEVRTTILLSPRPKVSKFTTPLIKYCQACQIMDRHPPHLISEVPLQVSNKMYMASEP